MSSDIKLDGEKVILEGNVGVGTDHPEFALDVVDRMRVRQAGNNTNNTAGIWFHQSGPAKDQAFVGMATDTSVGLWGNTGADWGLVMNTTTGNVGIPGKVGIGTLDPEFALDVTDRMRVRQAGNDTSNTAGIWFHQSGPAEDQAFVGMASDTSVGLWGNTGAEWGLVMDTTTGNITTTGKVGIGTPEPGFQLDVSDRMRVREGDNGTAGIWLHQSGPNKDQAFVGMASDTGVGFWGNTGANWGLVMDTTTGNVRIGPGQKAPNARLEVQGNTECSGRLSIRGQVKSSIPTFSPGTVVPNGGSQTVFIPSTIDIENGSIRVTEGAGTLDLVAEVRKLRAEINELKKQPKP